MSEQQVIIAGGGIGGLALALTLHEIGVSCLVLESVTEVKPLGVGINLQPNAVRELYDMGISDELLSSIGIPAKEWALVGLNGKEIYSEPRGIEAGYKVPQYAIHRGDFHLALYDAVCARLGKEAVKLGCKVTGYTQTAKGVTAKVSHADGTTSEVLGEILIGADGIHSAIRAQMHPDQPPIHWGGTLMWRGVTRAKAIRTGSSFVGLGTHKHRMVIYPISEPDENGDALINWIAEQTYDESHDWTKSGWFRPVELEDFAHHFKDFKYDWIDVPDLLARSEVAYENPMIDRDPVPTWADGRVLLIGDAAHAMYPTGSNGASQAIMDARIFGKKLCELGLGPDAIKAFDEELCGPISELILRNRGSGPFGLLEMVDERCGGIFDDIDDVIPAGERKDFMAGYKKAAGFAIEKLNAAPRTLPEGARVLEKAEA